MNTKRKVNSKVLALVITLFIIVMSIVGYVLGKYVLNKQNDAEINFYEYRIAKSEILISPEEYTGEEATVTITTEKPGLSIEYKIGDSEEWIKYTGPFCVDENTNIEARLVAENFEGPITDKEVTNIAVCRIGDTYYKTVESAIDACPENAGTGQTKIEMLTSVTESVIIPEGKNIVLDLCGKTISSKKEIIDDNTVIKDYTIIVSGKFNLIDSEGNGGVEAQNGTAITVESTGDCTIGINESEPNVENKPLIKAEINGVLVKEGGKFNFYDGEISGKTNAIDGTVTGKPEGYAVVASRAGEYEVATLRKTYTIKYNKNSEDAEIEYESQTVNSGEKVGKLPTATRTGYIFEGWYTAENDGEKVTIDTIVNEEVTYYAHWTAVTYKIEYSANGGSGEPIKTDCTYDKEATIEKNTYTAPVGYIFKEWNTKEDGTGTTYAEGATIKNLSGTQLDIITLYAIWEDKTEPSNNAPTGTSTTSQITVNCNQKDEGSGIDETTIEYSIFKDGKWSEWQASNVFDGLDADTEYQIKTRATDKDGNGPTESEIGKIKTKNIQIGTITIHKDTPDGEIVTPKTNKEDNEEQINNNIHIDITPEEGTTTIKVKTPDGETKTYTEDVTIETETGVYEITIETTDGTNTVTETVYVFVDKTPPTVNPTETHTTNKITIDSNAKDDNSGIKEIKYVVKNGDEEITTIIKTSEDLDKTAEVPELKDNTEYTVEITVTDNAGNESTKTVVVKTEELRSGSIEFTESTSRTEFTPTTKKEEDKVWTNENVQTKLTPGSAGITTYTIQKVGEDPSEKYTNDTEISTTDGDYIVTVETTDGTNTKIVTYYFSVDKLMPTVTITPNGAEHTIAVDKTTVDISATLTSKDNENGSGISINKYAWSTSKEEEPDSWTDDFVSGTPVTKTVNGGVYYLWTKVIDNAGNEAVSIKTSKEFNVGYAVEYDLNGGNGTIEKQRKVHGQDLTLTAVKPTKEGYIFKGWATSENAVSSEYSSSSIYSKDESVKLYAVWSEVIASTTIDGKTTNYDSVQNAINAAETNTAVVTLLKNEIDESVTIAAGQTITLDMNGKTLRSDKIAVTNNGILQVNGEGVISNTASELPTISNNGNLEITNGTISSENYQAINNASKGLLTISGGKIDAKDCAINNYGTSSDELNPSLKIVGGTVKSTTGYSIENVSTGTVVIHKGEISGVRNRNLAKIIMTGGIIENTNGHAIRNYTGDIEIRGGTIISSDFHDGIWTSGTGNVLVTGGTITGGTNGVVTTDGKGKITITGGTVKATSSYNDSGRAIASTGTVIIGNKEDSKIANIEEPILIGYRIGIGCDDIRFYDGIIKAPKGATIAGEVTETPRGYRVTNGEETIDGVKYETAYLDRADVEIEIDQTEYTYTGEEITPEIRVLDEDIVLVKGEDYDVTYSDNVEVGTGTIKVDLKGDYSGTKTITFTINKAILTPVATSDVKTYDGTTSAEGTVYLVGSVNNELPTVSDTYKFEFEDSTSGTNKKVNVTNIQLASSWEKNYTLSTNTLTLTDGAINKATLLAKYEGEKITYGQTPSLKVVVTGFVNNEDENTADGYKAPNITNINKEVGTYTLIPAGGEATNYTFEYEGGTLVIEENMANVIVTLNPEKYVYDGEEKKPEVIVTDKNTGKELTYGTDYTMSYKDNINAGTASVIINLKGNYSGTVIETFTIERASGEAILSIDGWTYGDAGNNPIIESSTNEIESVTYTYTGTKNNGEQYSSNIAPTDAGNYTVKAILAQTTNYNQIILEENFVIAKCVVAIPTANTELKYTGNAQTGVESGSNYSITGNVETNAGNYEAIATLSDGNNYEWDDKTVESKGISWQIAKIKLTPIATIEDKIYDGTTSASGHITLQGAVNEEEPSVTATFTYESAECGEQTVNVTDITLDDEWKTNYELVTDNLEATGNINKKEITVTKEDYIGVYDGKEHGVNVTPMPLENVEIYYSTTELTSNNYNVDGSKDKITMVNSGITTVYYYVHDLTGNYEDYASYAHSNNGTITISKVTLSVSASTNAKQYDGSTNATGTITLEGAVNNEKPTAAGRFAFETKDAVTRKTVNVEDITLDGDWNTNYTLNSKELVLTDGTITAKEVTPIITAEDKTYDGTKLAKGAITLDGIIDEDEVVVADLGYTFDTKDSGEGKTVTSSEIILSGEDSSNYVLSTNVATTEANIVKAMLIPVVTVENKVYDGTTDAKGTVTVEGAVNDEKPTAVATFMFEDKDVGTEKNVIVTNIALEDLWVTNYQLTQDRDEKTADITRAILKAKYEGETVSFGTIPTLKIKVTGFVNGENEDIAEDYIAPTISNFNIQVGSYELTPHDGSAKNYEFEYEKGILVIEPNNSNATVTLDNYEYIYTGEEHKPKATVTIEGTVLTEGQDYDVTYTNNINAGTATVKITLKGNYSGTKTESFIINKAEGTAQVTMEGWTYGETAKAPIVTSTTNDVNNVTYTYYMDEECTLKTTSEQGATENGGKPTDSGVYYVKAVIAETNNYKEVQITTSFEIKKVILTPTAILDNKTYDGTTKGTGKITFTEAVNGEIPTATAIFTYEDATSGTGKTVDVTEIELDSDWQVNYELSKNSITSTNGVINKAILTATYKSETINYGEDPNLEVILTGFVNNETEDVIETKPIVKNINTKVGTYTLTPEGGSAVNYDFKLISGTLTIRKRSIQDMSVSLDKTSYIYDGLEKEPVVTITNGETNLVEDIDYTVSYTNNVNAGTANIIIIGIGNYEGEITKEFTIEKANINVEVKNYNGTYDGQPHTITLQTTPSDNITIYYSTNKELKNNNYILEGDKSISSRTSVGTDTVYYYIHDKSGNYNDYSSSEKSTNGKIQINAKNISSNDITAKLDETAFEYNGDAKKPTPTIKDESTTLIVGKDYTVQYEDNINAGTAKAIITGTGNYSGNLELTFTITKKVLTLNVTAENKIYDTNNIASCELSLSGVVEGEDVTVTCSSSKFANSTVGTGKTVTITGITLHGDDSVNYKLQTTTATTKANITKKELAVTYVSETIDYGDTPILAVTVAGFAGSETAETAAGYTAPTVTNTNTAIGEYELTPNGGNATNYSFKYVSGTLTINARSNVTVTLSQSSYTYDGTAKKPTVIVKDKDSGDTVSTDNYTVTYTNNINAGTATVKVTLKGTYSGTVSKTFTINKANRTITAQAPLYVGKGTNKNLQFTYTGNSDVTATASSNNTGVVTTTITDGDKAGTVKITGVTSGTGTVTITLPEDANYNKATKTINVTVTDFTIAPTTGTIAKGGIITITPTITPTSVVNTNAATTISWKSGDTNIATIDKTSTTKGASINVTGVANGTVTITATLNGQSKTAKIAVNSVASTTIGSNTTYYTTVQKAIDAAGTNVATVKLLYSGSRTENVTVATGQNITLNTNGATLTSSVTTITNNGTLKIDGTGKVISTANRALANNGTATLTGTVEISSSATGASTVVNNGNLTVSGAKIISENYRGIYNGDTKKDDTVRLTITSGTIIADTANAVYNASSGIMTISGGNISSTEGAIYNASTGIITMSEGNVISENNTAFSIGNGTLEVTGGTVTGKSHAIWASNINKTTVTVGKNDSSVSINNPSITAQTRGVYVGVGEFNFYDGIIMGPAGNSIAGTVSKTPDNYVVVKGSKTVDGTTYETSVLGPSAPVVTAKLNNSSGAAYNSGTWTNNNVYVILASSNTGAGIKEYQWYENGAWTTRAITTSNNVGTIRYTVTRNETIRYRAIDNNGVISEEATFTVRIDKTLPTITVSPASATTCKTKSVTITVKDGGGSALSSGNSYQYYLSSNSTALSGGTWTNYTSGTAITIGTGVTGTRYLFVKRISDNAGNISTANGTATTISNVTYQRFGSYVFDNTKPTAIINTESMYVTDGLVTRLDGVNNNGGSHSSSVTTWKDLSSNGKNGTITAGTWGANYLNFNGTSSWVNLGVMNSDYQTIEVTFSPDVVPTSNTNIIGNWENGGGGISIQSGYISGGYYIGGSYTTIRSGVKVAANQKYHVALTYNGTAVILYVNGVEQGRISVSGTIGAPANNTVMALGVNPNGTTTVDAYFDGKIYTAAVYNKALTAAQVKTNADAGKALAGGPTNASNITYTIRFNETVTGFTTDDITVTNGTKGTFTEVTAGRVYKVAVTTAANQNNTQTVKLITNGCTDSSGNSIAETSKTVVIDRVAPTVTLSANGGTYNIAPGSTTANISTTLTASDTGSGVAGLGYAWATSNSTAPSSWSVFTSGTAITASRSGGNSYIWTNVIDNAGNRATSIKTSNAFTVRYQVVFNANSGSGAPGTQYKVHGTNLTLSSTKPTRTGYTFKEWNTKVDGTGTNYVAGASYTANSAVTLYAIWTVNTYKITLNNQSATSAGSTEFYVQYSNGYYKESACQTTITSITVPTKTNWIFQGYYTETNGGGTQIIDASGKITSNMTTTKFTANTTLYAYWITNYQNTTLGKYYLTLGQALSEVNSSSTATHTIKVLRSFTDIGGMSSIGSGKTVNFEVDRNTVNYAGYGCVINNGTLNVNGSGTISSFNGTSDSYGRTGATIVNSGGTLNLKGNVKIENTSTSEHAAAVTNEIGGTINVTSATIVGDQVGIYTYPNSSGSGSKIIIASGSSVTGTNMAGLSGGESVTIDGTVTGKNGIETESGNGYITITGTGTVTGSTTSSDSRNSGIEIGHSMGAIVKDGIKVSGYNGLKLTEACTTTVSGSSTNIGGIIGIVVSGVGSRLDFSEATIDAEKTGIEGHGGTITIRSGEIKGAAEGINLVEESTTQLTMDGGIIKSRLPVSHSGKGTVNITGGTLESYNYRTWNFDNWKMYRYYKYRFNEWNSKYKQSINYWARKWNIQSRNCHCKAICRKN